jgi:hypothetical protein
VAICAVKSNSFPSFHALNKEAHTTPEITEIAKLNITEVAVTHTIIKESVRGILLKS